MRLKTTAILGLATILPVMADPLTDLIDTGGDGVCFDRVYDAAHLARVPGQDTRRATLSLARDEAGFDWATIRIVLEGKERTSIVVGECSWKERANLDIMDQPLLDTFKGGPGLDCHAYASVDGMSAEEGGDFVVDLRSNSTVFLHLPDAIAAWPTFQRRNEASWEDFGVDDRVFRLDRAERELCRGMEEALPGFQ